MSNPSNKNRINNEPTSLNRERLSSGSLRSTSSLRRHSQMDSIREEGLYNEGAGEGEEDEGRQVFEERTYREKEPAGE